MWLGMEKDASTRLLASAWILFAYGILGAIITTAVTVFLTESLLSLWADRIDFLALPEGSEYAALGLPIFDLILLLIVFAGLVPLVYADHRRVNNRTPIVPWRLALIGTLLASIPSVAIGLSGGLLYFLAHAVPIVFSAMVGLLVVVRIANRELTRSDRAAGGA
jgi:hypothetical protein